MPKPWPEKPVAMTKPGTSSTVEITGTASGVTSISPAHSCTTLAPAKAGNCRARAAMALRLAARSGSGSSTRAFSKGEAWSSGTGAASRHSCRKRSSSRIFSPDHSIRSAGRKSLKKRKLSGTSGAMLELPLAMV